MGSVQKKAFNEQIIKKTCDDKLKQIAKSKCNFNTKLIFSNDDFRQIKASFVGIFVLISKNFEKNQKAATNLLGLCAKTMMRLDSHFLSKIKGICTIFSRREYANLIWCFDVAKYGCDDFWVDLFKALKKRQMKDIDALLLTKFAWSICRVREYLIKHERTQIVHECMHWMIGKCVYLSNKKKIMNVLTIKQLSIICWAIRECANHSNMAYYDEKTMRIYTKFFKKICDDKMNVMDGLNEAPNYYLNVCSAMIVFKDRLLKSSQIANNEEILIDIEEDDIRQNVIAFLKYALNEFVVTERGVNYIKNDAEIACLLLHIASEIQKDVAMKDNMEKVNKILQYLQAMKVKIGHENALSIICVLSNIPMNDSLNIMDVHKAVEILVNVLMKEAKRCNQKRKQSDYLPLEHLLGVVSCVLAHSSEDVKFAWNGDMIQMLMDAAKYYLRNVGWKDEHFLLKKQQI